MALTALSREGASSFGSVKASQYADWYAQKRYRVSVEPSPRELPEFLRTLAPDIIARRDGENVVQIKTSSPASFEAIHKLARALEHRAGWELQVVYVDLPDPEWQPPPRLPERKELLARLDLIGARPRTSISVEEDDCAVLRRGLAVRNVIAHGFLNKAVDAALFEEIRGGAKDLLSTPRKAITPTRSPAA